MTETENQGSNWLTFSVWKMAVEMVSLCAYISGNMIAYSSHMHKMLHLLTHRN